MRWDYIVVGAGSAGCALTHELVRAGKTVLLIEAGGRDRSPYIKVPAGVLRSFAAHDWGYRSQPDPTRNGVVESWTRGRVLGGSSSINGMIYVRGAAEDFDRWAERCAHAGGWAADEVIGIFRQLERSDQRSPLRGDSGRLHVKTVMHAHPVTKAFVESALAAGHRFNEDYNGRSQEGVSYFQRTVHKGLRWSAADAFLKPLLGRDNLKVVLHATVEKIEIAGGRATGVVFSHDGMMVREEGKDIVLCAGAINSPKLLMLSGVGDARELGRHGIRPVLDLPEVGRNLKEHPFVRMIYRSRVPTYNLTEGLLQKLQILAKYLRHQEGPIAGGYESTVFLKTSPEDQLPDVQLYFAPIGYFGKTKGSRAAYPAFMIGVAKMRPLSSGRISLASNDPKDAPVIDCRLFSLAPDVQTLVRGIQAARDITRSDPLGSVVEREISPGVQIDDAAALQDFVINHAEVSSHPNGTCRMGADSGAVVGPNLCVRGTGNLWVADASIIPDHISANLNAVCMMIGMKLGQQLAAKK